MGYDDRWEAEQQDARRSSGVAGWVVWVACLVFLALLVLVAVFGPWYWTPLLISVAVSAVLLVVVQGND